MPDTYAKGPVNLQPAALCVLVQMLHATRLRQKFKYFRTVLPVLSNRLGSPPAGSVRVSSVRFVASSSSCGVKLLTKSRQAPRGALGVTRKVCTSRAVVGTPKAREPLHSADQQRGASVSAEQGNARTCGCHMLGGHTAEAAGPDLSN